MHIDVKVEQNFSVYTWQKYTSKGERVVLKEGEGELV